MNDLTCACGKRFSTIYKTETFDYDGKKLIVLDVPVSTCSSESCEVSLPFSGTSEICTIDTLKKLTILEETFKQSLSSEIVMNPTIVKFPKPFLLVST